MVDVIFLSFLTFIYMSREKYQKFKDFICYVCIELFLPALHYTLVWWRLKNFILRQVNLHSFLHPNKPLHSEPKCQIWVGNCSWGYSAQIWHFSIPLAFLGAKDFKKIIKGRQRLERPNQRPGTGEFKFWPFFHVIVIIWCWLCMDFIIF